MTDNWDQSPDQDDFMDAALPACKFETIGTIHGGLITRVTKKPDTDPSGAVKKWDNGDPKSVYVFELDGVKALYVRGNMVKAIREALGSAKQLATGSRIEVKYYAQGTPTKPGFSPPKLFMARVLRPGDSPDPAAQPAPVAAQPAAAAAGAPAGGTVPW